MIVKDDLNTLDYQYFGEPFVRYSTSAGVTTSGLDIQYFGEPFFVFESGVSSVNINLDTATLSGVANPLVGLTVFTSLSSASLTLLAGEISKINNFILLDSATITLFIKRLQNGSTTYKYGPSFQII